MEVSAILKKNPGPIYTIAGDRSIKDALNLMSSRKVDALIVTEDEQPVGIFAESDLLRYYQQTENLPPSKTKLIDIITGRLMTVAPTDNITTAVDLMVKSDIRHLPVMETGKIIGVLTLKDVVESQIDLLTDEIVALQDYIDDLHEASQD